MSSKTYDFIKKIALKYMPALQTCWITIAFLWDFDYHITYAVAGTIGAIGVCLGKFIGVSAKNYYANINEDPSNGVEVEE